MKKAKRFLALAGAVVLVCLYLATLICALIQSDRYMTLLFTSVYCTVVIPVLIWAYSFIYKLIHKDESEDK